MRSQLLLIALCLTLNTSCGDYLNSKGSPPQGGGTQLKSKNPFPPGFDPASAPFTEQKMLASMGVRVIAPATREFRFFVEALELQLSKRRTSLNELRGTWTSAMLAYHFLQATAVGPLADRRLAWADNIYSWPRFNPCGVDLEVAKQASTGQKNSGLMFTEKGLGALEYLLFEPTLGTACNPNNRNHKAAVEWSQKPEAERLKDRLQFAHWLAKDLLTQARTLEAAWDVDGGNFSYTLVDNSYYGSLNAALNAMSDAVFGLEDLKDRRLGRPLGRHKDCGQDKCPQDAEHRWSGLALAAMATQLEAVWSLMRGHLDTETRSYYGFDDFLQKQGHAGVWQNLQTRFENLHAMALNLAQQGPLQTQIEGMDGAACKATTVENRVVPLCAFHQDVRILVNSLRSEFITALSLRAPPKHQGDND